MTVELVAMSGTLRMCVGATRGQTEKECGTGYWSQPWRRHWD